MRTVPLQTAHAVHRSTRSALRGLGWAAATWMAAALCLAPSAARAQIDLSNPPVGWVAPLDFSTYSLSAGTAVAYRTDYIRSTWDGDLIGHSVGSSGSMGVLWRAREKLPAWDQRFIFTMGTAGAGVRFTAGAGGLSSQQLQHLGADTTAATSLLNWIRGDASQERTATKPSLPYRSRLSRLGAMVHSRPLHDAGTVYVGSNGGMMHAFDAATGVERWAYVPSMLLPSGRFQALAQPDAQVFPYLVDGSSTVGTVGQSKLLISTLGLGGRGLFALDVTQPVPASETAAATMARWEVSSASTGFANMGFIASAPRLVKLNNGTTAVLVPNGLNGASGRASLFVIRASDGALLAEIPAGTATGNALGAVAAVDRDGNGTVDVAYAGDLAGTLWKFDLSAVALPSAGAALFTPATDVARPITAAPSVVLHPRGGLMVTFGTGRLLTAADLAGTDTEYLYGIWDSPLATAALPVVQTLTTHSPAGLPQARSSSSTAVNYAAGARGWRIALTGGERLVGTDTMADSGRFIITTTVPGGASPTAWLMQLDALTGGAPASPFFDLNGDGQVRTDTSDHLSVSGVSVVPVGRRLGTGVWSQPVLAQVSKTLDLPFLNQNPNTLLAAYTTTVTQAPPTPGESGVYGGHFDFDIFYGCKNDAHFSKDSCSTNVHVHEYDDKYNVVGVNMLNASVAAFNLRNAITSTTTPQFKILVANTRWSPAASLVIGDSVAAMGWQLPLSPDGFVAATAGGAALTFNRQSLTKFIFALPNTAFSNRDWGTGDVRAGLIPTQTGCVRDNTKPTTAFMDGAFTVQVVHADTAGNDVQAVAPADAGGFRLKDTKPARGRLLAQYTAFWHHPNKVCKTESGWTKAPPADTSPAGDRETAASGSDDPKGSFYSGTFGSSGGSGGGVVVKHFLGSVEVTVSRVLTVDGVQQILRNTSGTVVSTTSSTFGSPQRTDLQQTERARLGRLGWREVLR